MKIHDFSVISQAQGRAQLVYTRDGRSITRHVLATKDGFVYSRPEVKDESGAVVSQAVHEEFVREA